MYEILCGYKGHKRSIYVMRMIHNDDKGVRCSLPTPMKDKKRVGDVYISIKPIQIIYNFM